MTVYLRYTTNGNVYTVAESAKNPPTIVLTPHKHNGGKAPRRQTVSPAIVKAMLDAEVVEIWDDAEATNGR